MNKIGIKNNQSKQPNHPLSLASKNQIETRVNNIIPDMKPNMQPAKNSNYYAPFLIIEFLVISLRNKYLNDTQKTINSIVNIYLSVIM